MMQPPAGIAAITDQKDMDAYVKGVRGEFGTAPFVLLPKTTQEVVRCVEALKDQPFVAQSGNTGLVGASVPEGEAPVLSLSKLKEVFELDVANRSLRVSAGYRLSEINERLKEHGLFFPIELGSDPLIGGMIATNTGGARFVRYGDVRRHVLALDVVTKSGEILSLGGAMRKNNTGTDWKQNFIGSADWYGVITEATLNVEPLIEDQAAALVVPSSPEAMLTLLSFIERRVGPLLSAYELMSQGAIKHSLAHAPSLSNPFAGGVIPETTLLIELSRPQQAEWDTPLDEILQTVLSEAWELDSAPIEDALFGRVEEIWALRHALSEGVKSAGPLIALDLGFTRSGVVTFRPKMADLLAEAYPMIEVCDFGHLGDGGLHYDLIKTDGPNTPTFDQELRDFVIKHAVEEFGASYSAEHGIGPKNRRYFDRYAPKGVAAHLG